MSDVAARWEQAFAARLRPLLARMKGGEDVPPAERFRAEGFAEAGLALALCDAASLARLIQTLYAEAPFGFDAAALAGRPVVEWIDSASGRVELCFRHPRAPVYRGTPST